MDSGNTAMKYKSSLPHNKGRFFLLFLLFTGFHMMQAVCRPEETYDHLEIDEGAKIVIAEGTVVSGLENLYIASAETKKAPSQPKKLKKISAVKKLDSQKAEDKTSKNKQNSKPEITALASRLPSSDSFEVSKFSKSVGTINATTHLKSALHSKVIDITTSSISFFNNSLYTYTLPFTKGITDRYSFARPPPVV